MNVRSKENERLKPKKAFGDKKMSQNPKINSNYAFSKSPFAKQHNIDKFKISKMKNFSKSF